MAPKIHIRKEAFFNMIYAAAETFKKECLGVAFGYNPTKTRKYFLITSATALQCVRTRKNTEVEQSQGAHNRLLQFFPEKNSFYRKLGFFHSHPEWGKAQPEAKMSKGDIADMIKEDDLEIEIIIAVTSRKKGLLPWTVDPDGSISGSLGTCNFQFAIYILNKEKKPERIQIVTPQALRALNRAQKRILKNKMKK